MAISVLSIKEYVASAAWPALIDTTAAPASQDIPELTVLSPSAPATAITMELAQRLILAHASEAKWELTVSLTVGVEDMELATLIRLASAILVTIGIPHRGNANLLVMDSQVLNAMGLICSHVLAVSLEHAATALAAAGLALPAPLAQLKSQFHTLTAI